MEWVIPIISVVISGVITVWVQSKNRNTLVIRERYEKLYFPMFVCLEPFLFKPLDAQCKIALNRAIQIYLKNRSLAGGRLDLRVYSCQPVSKCKKDDFVELCDYVSREYDKLSKQLGIPIRSLLYRYKRNQFKTKYGAVIFIIWYASVNAALLLLFGAIFLVVLALITQLAQYLVK